MPKYFGTDGIRGVAGVDLTTDLAHRVGLAAGRVFAARMVLLARDTRPSGPALEAACADGLAAAGAEVHLAGILPSPAVSHLVRRERYDLGVVISASHNPPQDNGIKLYDGQGLKLSPEEEDRVEALFDARMEPGRRGATVVRADAAAVYRSLLRSAVPRLSLAGLRVAVDCAHGATCGLAPGLFAELGADVVPLGGEPDGTRINATGAAALGPLQEAVRQSGVDLGIAFDGDGDRVMFVDAQGQPVEGDRLLAALAPLLWRWKEISSPAVVVTVLANMGTEEYLRDHGIRVMRVPVGDRNVAWAMRREGIELGGEPSGHIVFGRHAPTGDGILTALLALQVLRRAEMSLGDLVTPVPTYPQVREDVPVANREVALAAPSVQRAIGDAERLLDGRGRLIVRRSGTQSLVRVVAEGPDEASLRLAVAKVTGALDPFRDEQPVGEHAAGSGPARRTPDPPDPASVSEHDLGSESRHGAVF